MTFIRAIVLVSISMLPVGSVAAAQAASPVVGEVQELLAQGESDRARDLLLDRIEGRPDDAEARFLLGAVQAMEAVEGLSQDAHRYGLGSGSAGEVGGLFGIAVPAPVGAEPVGHGDLRDALERFHDRLVRADETLEPLSALAGSAAGASLNVRLELGRVRLDFDGDGTAGEPLATVAADLRNLATSASHTPEDDVVPLDLDLGDALWLRGYLNLVAGTVDVILAHDTTEVWDATAQLFFARARTAYPYLAEPTHPALGGFDLATLADAVALVHLIDLPVVEPERMRAALARFETTVALSRASWKSILAETDDGREWLPAPRQTGVIPTRPGGPPVAVTDEMIESWFVLLGEAEAILAGRTLVPHWRVSDGRGVNVRRVFLEPRRFDLVLWLQGAAVAPYLEEGDRTSGDTWDRIMGAFGGRFASFAFWFN